MGGGGGGSGGGGGGGGRTSRTNKLSKVDVKSKTGPSGEQPAFSTQQVAGGEPIVAENNMAYYGLPEDVLPMTQRMVDAEKLSGKLENQRLSNYRDLLPVENSNRKILANGLVAVGPKGAPKLPSKLVSRSDAIKRLREMGFPDDRAFNNIVASGDAPKIVALLPKGSKYLGEGVEGVGVALPGGKSALRIQHGGGVPLMQANVGKVGVYSQWQQRYGTMWVEKKEAIAVQAKYFKDPHLRRVLKVKMEANMRKTQVGLHDVDAHDGNWGIDYRGRARVFDPGAYRPLGDYKGVGKAGIEHIGENPFFKGYKT